MSQAHIDELLVQYLALLDEYTKLRQELSKLQASVYQDIARANFSAERGLRYGQDHYDDRMQALRRLEITAGEADVPAFVIAKVDSTGPAGPAEERSEPAKEGADEKPQEGEKDAAGETKAPKQRNPLHWFGLLAPMPLRNAQAHSIEAVERVIPRLASLSAEMLNLEIEVGRARKRRAKAEAAARKETTNDGSNMDAAATPNTAVEAS
ncbi:Coiled-coil domain-containing protein [Paramyrothecium foliicola]|nr:Coiled-coil domain-containing protein [Paramyrothecium foliicola]